METKKYKGTNWGSFIVFLVIIIGALWFMGQMQQQEQQMTYMEFLQEVEKGNVADPVISQNDDVPTGYVEVVLLDQQVLKRYTYLM